MRPPLTRPVAILSILVLISAACTSDGPSDKDVLISLTDGVVVPAYQTVARDMAQLEQHVRALCNTASNPSLETARRSWRVARGSWMRSEAMWFGPVMTRRSTSQLDWSPIDASGIDQLLAQEHPIAAEDVAQILAANQRGFGAMEHILFNGEAAARLTDSTSACSYLVALTEASRRETDAVLSEWMEGTEGQAAYHAYFTDRSSIAILPSAAVADVVRIQVFLIRNMVDMKLASALGLRDGIPDPSAIPGTAAENDLQDMRHEIMGMQTIYEGSGPDGLGISDLVRPLSQETDQRLRNRFAAALSAIDAVDGPLRTAAVEQPEQVRIVYERLSDVQQTMATEVVSLLGVSVGFTDTDGDTLR